MKFSISPPKRFIQRVVSPAARALMVIVLGHSTSHAATSAPPAFAADRPLAYATAPMLPPFKLDGLAIKARKAAVIPVRFAKLIDEAARKAVLEPALVHAIIAVESAYNPAARSAKGAIGLMQVLPETALRYGVADPASSPEANLRAGTRYLRYLMELFGNRIDLVLAAYNAGENAVLRHGRRIPPFRETQQYVPAVLARYHALGGRVSPVAPAPVRIRYMPGTALDFGPMDAIPYRTQSAYRHDPP